MKLLIKNGHVVDFKTKRNEICDILIDDGIIKQIGDIDNTSSMDFIDASGKYVIPGLVDAHCHLRDPGYEYKEDIETGSASAAAGGFTTIACMPNTNPPIDNQSLVKYIINKSKQEAYINVFPIGAITKGLKGEELSEIGELKFAGAAAISDDGMPVMNSSLMKKALQYASMFDITVISHCEDLCLAEEGVINEGYESTVLGLRGIPSISESVMVARELLLAEYTNAGIHIAHVSSEASVNLIRNAKKRGVKVTAETCPHYFSLTEDACENFNTLAKVNPPLKTQRDVDAIIEGLKDGTIDIIATDHAPHHADEKNVEFDLAAFGMVGFETALPLVITNLVTRGILSIEDIVMKMCYNPSKILSLNKGVIEEGRMADITIFDANEEQVININNFKSKSKNSPFNGFKLKGVVYHTIVNGKPVVREKVLL